MTAIKAFVKGHPVISYYALAFAIVGCHPLGGRARSRWVLGHPTAVPGGRSLRCPGDDLGPRPVGILLTAFLYGRSRLRGLDLGCSSGGLALDGTR